MGNRNKRANVGRTHTRVFARVLAHVNDFTGLSDGLKSSFYHCFRFANEGDDCSIGSGSRVNIKEFHAFYGVDGIGDLFDYGGIATL